jgi:deazaflavin-dependent oxidoreductase (nitroreductase family)
MDAGVRLPADLDEDDFCYVTTRGRLTGRPHEIEIWFARRDSTLYLLSGGGDRSDWVRNLRADPAVSVRLRDRAYDAQARMLTPDRTEDGVARALVFEKYRLRYSGSLEHWRDDALAVALDLVLPEPGFSTGG